MAYEEIKDIYSTVKNRIIERLDEFERLSKRSSEEEIFYELVFCLLTPQSKALSADKAIKTLLEKSLIFSDEVNQIADILKIVRFKNNKARYIVQAKYKFMENNKIFIKKYIDTDNIFQTREWFWKNIKGIGLKEASHFLRNIGFGENIAILDRHILRNLEKFKVISEIPKTITKDKYYAIEAEMKDFSSIINIPLSHLDFVLWYKEAGDIFK